MEIFLLFILILVTVILQTARNSKLNAIESKLSGIEAYLRQLTFKQTQKETPVKEERETEPAREESVNYRTFEEKITPVQEPPLEDEEAEEDKPQVILNLGSIPLETEELVDEEQIVEEQELVEEEQVSEEEKAIEEPEPVIEEEPETTEELSDPEEEKIPEPAERAYAAIHAPGSQPFEAEENWYTRFRNNNPDLEKYIGENILSKIAITILVIGIAFFVKFAIDKDWINEIARVGIGILCGGIILGFAHRLRTRFKAFSSVLVAGGIAIFYFSVGIGFHQYHIFSQTVAFVIMFMITAFSVFISVSYDRVELAVLSIIGGFATPFMVSTGQGNYQVLFVYILILDTGMLVLAYLRKWNLVNILAYCFTMLLYIVWLESKVIYNPRGPYEGALLFGAIFYVVFVLMNIVNNVKEKRKFDAFELSILLSNTFLFYGEGMRILDYFNESLQGLFSVCMAVFNLVCAWLLYKKFRADEKLVYLMIGLTLTFITISAPVQLDGNHITLFWALESLLLMWLAQRSGIVIYRFASVIIMSMTVLSLCMDWTQVYRQYNPTELNILLNKGFITGLVSALSIGATILLLRKEYTQPAYEPARYAGVDFDAKHYSSFLRLLVIGLFYCVGLFELMHQLSQRMDTQVAFYIIVEAYHLLYVVALNFFLARYNNRYVVNTVYILNALSLVVFVLGFTWLPINDFRENIIRTEMNYAGFLLHYASIAAAVFIAIRTYRMIRDEVVRTSIHPDLLTVGLSVVLVYFFSIELILHTAQFTMGCVTDTTVQAMMTKLAEFRTVSLHVVKIGFPILWGILAFVFLSIGMKNHIKTFRISGLVLIALILLKLFTYDIKDATQAGKIIAFIILGIVLLIISFMYQKIKVLLKDDKREETETLGEQK